MSTYKPQKFANLLGCSVKTLQRWDREGVLTANRTATGLRDYTHDQYLEHLGLKRKGSDNCLCPSFKLCTKTRFKKLAQCPT